MAVALGCPRHELPDALGRYHREETIEPDTLVPLRQLGPWPDPQADYVALCAVFIGEVDCVAELHDNPPSNVTVRHGAPPSGMVGTLRRPLRNG